jgi:hypothetical protein
MGVFVDRREHLEGDGNTRCGMRPEKKRLFENGHRCPNQIRACSVKHKTVYNAVACILLPIKVRKGANHS